MSDYTTDGKGQNTMGKKLQPKLRFRGFTDAWEQRPFGKVYTRCTEKNNPIRFGVDKIITVASMQYAPRHGCTNNEYLLTYNVMKLGDIAFEGNRNKRFPFGRFVENMIGEGIVSHVFSVYRPIVKQSSLLFLKYYINNDYVIRNMLRKSTIAATMMRTLVDADLMRQTLTLPSGREQEKIGKLFVDIDNLIDAEKRKLQLIGMKKRLLLQRILSRKMRFVGFCDSWIQLKLDDAICVCSGKDYKHLSKGNIPVYGTGGYMTSVSKALSNRDAIGIGRKGTIDKPYVLHAPFWTVDTLFYALPRNGYDLNFLFAVFQNINWKSKNESTGLPSLSKKNIENTSIITPSIDEQCRIGELFSLFDSILDETNQKIRLLEKKKKALLRDMFV